MVGIAVSGTIEATVLHRFLKLLDIGLSMTRNIPHFREEAETQLSYYASTRFEEGQN
jgi:hypothetical protein